MVYSRLCESEHSRHNDRDRTEKVGHEINNIALAFLAQAICIPTPQSYFITHKSQLAIRK